jgi:hypothetical protein
MSITVETFNSCNEVGIMFKISLRDSEHRQAPVPLYSAPNQYIKLTL